MEIFFKTRESLYFDDTYNIIDIIFEWDKKKMLFKYKIKENSEIIEDFADFDDIAVIYKDNFNLIEYIKNELHKILNIISTKSLFDDKIEVDYLKRIDILFELVYKIK